MALSIRINKVNMVTSFAAGATVANTVVFGGTTPYIYSLATGEDKFAINSATGAVTVKAAMNISNIASFSVTVTDSTAGTALTITSEVTYPPIQATIQSEFNSSNVIYKITKDIDLGNGILTIPEGCTLDFQGGSFSDGTIIGNSSSFMNPKKGSFSNITFSGTYLLSEIYTDHFSYINDNTLFNNLQVLCAGPVLTNLYFENRVYNVSIAEHDGAAFRIPSNVKIRFDGEVKLAANSLTNYKVWEIIDEENITVTGTGKITGDGRTHTGIGGEWGHTFHILGGKNIELDGLTLQESWGDGLSIDSSEQGGRSLNVKVHNIFSINNRRQGISIEGAKDIYISECTIIGTGSITATLPSAAIDVEPWRVGDVAENILIHDCFEQNNILGYAAFGNHKNVTYLNCISESGACSATANNLLSFDGCSLKGEFTLKGKEVSIRNCNMGIISFEDIEILNVSNCTLDSNRASASQVAYYASIIAPRFVDFTKSSSVTFDKCYFNLATTCAFNWGTGGVNKSINFYDCTINDMSAGAFAMAIMNCSLFGCTIMTDRIDFANRANKELMLIGNTIKLNKPYAGDPLLTFNNELQFDLDPSITAYTISGNLLDAPLILYVTSTPWSNYNVNIINNTITFGNLVNIDDLLKLQVTNFKGGTFSFLYGRRAPMENSTSVDVKDGVYNKGLTQFRSDLNRLVVWNGSAWAPVNGGPLTTLMGTSAQRPSLSSYENSYQYYDTTLNKPIWWNGTAWKDATGATV